MTSATLAPTTSPISMRTLIDLTSHLAQVLVKEIECLKTMKVREVEKLQKEKLRLTSALETLQKEIERNPDIRRQFSEDEMEEYSSVSQVFQEILLKNFRQLMVARDINTQVVSAVRDTLIESQSAPLYTGQGKGEMPPGHTLSIAINDVI